MTRSARSGIVSRNRLRNTSSTLPGSLSAVMEALLAPAWADCSRIDGISRSERPGITGAMNTLTGTPASQSRRIASNRRAGGGA